MNKHVLIVLILLTVLAIGCAKEAATPTPTATAVPPTATATAVASELAAAPTAEPTATTEPTATATATPTLEPEPAFEPLFEEGPCPFTLPPNETEGETILCGMVTVPEERTEADGPTIRLAVAVFKAQSSAPQPDPVILLSGGPGEKTVSNALLLSQVLASFRDERDLIVFDQRGVGLSEPALECPEVLDALFGTLDELDPQVALQTQFDATVACGDRLAAEGHNLSAYNTTENATDVDDIRRALGYEQLNLYGGSYGTLLAQAVMRDHPEGVRSVVLGAVLPAEKSFFVHVPTTVVNAALDLMAACAADTACNEAYPDLQQTLYDTIDQLNAEPIPIVVTNPLDGQSYDTWLTGDGVFGNLTLFLYLTDIIPVLPQAIHDVANEDYELMTQLSSTSLALYDALSRGMEFSVFCAEDLIGVTPEDFLETRLRMPPQLAGSIDPEDVIEYSFFGICENWPVEEADPAVKEPVASDLPTLILEGEFDPVTPLAYAEEVAQYLSNSYLYEFPGVGHDILVASECAREIADQFLDDPTSEPDASCIEGMPGVTFDLPQAESETIALEPVSLDIYGLSGLAPADWNEMADGIFVRQDNSLDSTALLIQAAPLSQEDLMATLTAQLALDEAPEASGERETEHFTWTLYETNVQGVAIDIAMATMADGSTAMVLLQSASDERDALQEEVFFPVLDSLAPID